MSEMETNTPKYWLSLEQWRQDPEFIAMAEKEFLSSPLQESESEGGGWARREFLKLMGASLALTSFGCMRRPAQLIVPYAKKPVEVVHGVANYYASTYVDGQEALGILVTSRDGRPVKIEGNPDHPLNQGGMSARAHAHILSLYDPDRLNGPRKNLLNEKKTNRETVNISYEALDKAVVEQLKKGGVGLLSAPSLSPSTTQLIGDFASTYGAKLYSWEPLSFPDAGLRYQFEKAKLVVSVGNDFLGVSPMAVSNNRSFGAARKPGKEMCKLVVFESLMSLTGTNADERYRIGANQEEVVLLALVKHLGGKGAAITGDAQAAVRNFADQIEGLALPAGTLEKIGDQLWENRGRSLVLAGGWARGAGSSVATAAAQLLNSVLGNDGVTLGRVRPALTGAGITSLIADLNSGKIKTLVIHGCNPVFSAPTSGFLDAVKKATTVIYTGDRMDETGLVAEYLVPDHHPLENWGDVEALPGVFTIQQPTIRPLYDTRAFEDSLLVWMKEGPAPARAKGADTWYSYVVSNWRALHSKHRGRAPADKSFEQFWESVLQLGVFDTAGSRGMAAVGLPSGASFSVSKREKSQSYKLSLYATVGLRDGTLANVPWLQEFPDPVTKICWDNYLTVSPADAAKERWSQGDVLKIGSDSVVLEVPVHIQPGQADGVLGLAVGYGHTRAGKVANHVGQNAYRLVNWTANGEPIAAGIDVKVQKTGKHYDLACTQGHHSMEGRQIVIEATLAQFMENPSANIHRHKVFSMWNDLKYPNNKWGMVIDLNSCTGCGACVVACQSENNVPTVGKRHVLMGREMHWLRIDRYYVGEADSPDVVHQPVVCMHCDNAPCETVCPVIATVHSDEGTNDMIYNRCVGTRYCSNNCPYKVRRFNYFNYVKTVEKPRNYAMNPDVTVRDRGVMEKCTFCIHRIRGVKTQARVQDRPLKDGDVKTACQQSCPTNAIVFGDLNDSESQVRKAFDQQNTYALLEELNTQPAVRYSTKIRNTSSLKGGGKHHEGSHGEGKHS